jgi:metal-responsive CopG/Arc/MetJ family transcriptional regulator
MTIEIEIDEKTLAEVNEAIEVLEQNRDDVFREAMRDLAKKKKREAEVRQMYANAYRKNPQTREEIEEWEEVQSWGDR